MIWSSGWSALGVLIILLLNSETPRSVSSEPIFAKVVVPASHTALSGDLTVFILESSQEAFSTTPIDVESETERHTKSEGKVDEEIEINTSRNIVDDNALVLRVLFLDGFTSELVGEFPLETLPRRGENVSLVIPCGFFSRGGTYSLQLQDKHPVVPAKITDIADLSTIQMSNALDVKWPTPSLFLERQHFTTYPNEPITAVLRYSEISCEPSDDVPVALYTLQLIYCGSSAAACDPQNKSRAQVLYYEELKGFSAQKVIVLHCEYFGLAGDYAIRLKASSANPNAPTTSAYMKVDWSNEFVFDVHARSIYPCEGSGGVPVIFEYPSCRLQGDRVRVYGRLRADVRSLAPPSTLHYIAELKAVPGKHTLTFECDIFTEKFIEYCFVYVSQAITGAMAEVKLSCIPTFPLQENDAGGWGPWSPWTPCSSSCIGGIRNRYRFCDTPPPRYGAKFCQGKAVETEACGGSQWLNVHDTWNMKDWECRHGAELAATRPEIAAEIGTKCRCGCIVNLEEKMPRKLLAANTQACPGRSFWLVQARPSFLVRLHVDQAQFPCPGQYFRVRDGDSLSADLLTDIAFDKSLPSTGTVISSGQSLLLEFSSDEVTAAGESCIGGFLAHAVILYKHEDENGTLLSVPFKHNSTSIVGEWIFWMTPAHLVAASLLLLIFFVSISLALQFAFKYRKYHIAEDLDALSDYSGCSDLGPSITKREKAISSSTLISEVVSLVGLSRRNTPNHKRLKNISCETEDGYDSSETQAEFEDETSADSDTVKVKDSEDTCSQKTMVSSKADMSESVSFMSNVVFVGQPEVKYARPVKLKTLGPQSPVLDNTPNVEESQAQNLAEINISNPRLRHCSPNFALHEKEFSPVRIFPRVPGTLRSGKENKDRRNRERLLHGPGSEFSLANPDADLELDYYDYNVSNASAVPGSYLGMDPAFLVWIPPLLSADSDTLSVENADEGNHTNEEAATVDTEGTTLTPSEYRRMRLSRTADSKTNLRSEDFFLNRCDSRGNVCLEDGICDVKGKLIERILPIHRILEDSRIRVSEESLASQILKDKSTLQNVIPNRLQESYDASLNRTESERLTSAVSPDRVDNQQRTELPKHLKLSNVAKSDQNGINSLDNSLDDKLVTEKSPVLKRHQQEASYSKLNSCYKPKGEKKGRSVEEEKFEMEKIKDEEKSSSLYSNAVQFKYKDFTHFTQPCENKRNIDTVNIPMTELSRGCLKSPVRVHKQMEKKKIVQEEMLSPDYGVETDMKDTEACESYYDLIRDGDANDGIKFADEDEEYIDNKIST